MGAVEFRIPFILPPCPFPWMWSRVCWVMSMPLIAPRIVAPDSSHWAKWIDATVSRDPARRTQAFDVHRRLLDQGHIPLLSWHHLEELLGIDDEQRARSRVACIQSLSLVAWLRLPRQETGLGSIVQIIAAEAIAASDGLHDRIAIRDCARQMLLRTGSGTAAIGAEAWVWDAIRPHIVAGRPHADMVAALSAFSVFDEDRTIGDLSRASVNSATETLAQLEIIHAKMLHEVLTAGDGDASQAKATADAFVSRVVDSLPPPGTSVRDLLVSTLVARGVDAEEVRDDSILADLNALATFRSQLRVVASDTGWSFDDLKCVSMEELPSWLIRNALRRHGQRRTKRPGSDLTDGYLGTLAAYSDVLYVDKRTAEDFRRAMAKEPKLQGLVGNIAKAKDFTDLVAAAA